MAFTSSSQTTGNWVPLLEYALKNEVSLSTLRRHIKAGKIDHKIENGRYLLWDENGKRERQLESELERAKEEIAELKMLIALYEEKLPHPAHLKTAET